MEKTQGNDILNNADIKNNTVKNVTDVIIDGKVYRLKGTETEDYLQKVGRYIDKKITEIRTADANRMLTTNLLPILTSINVAVDYFKNIDKMSDKDKTISELEKTNSELRNTIHSFENELGKLESENSFLKDKIKEFQMHFDIMNKEYLNLQTEFEDYIDNFDNFDSNQNHNNVKKIKSFKNNAK